MRVKKIHDITLEITPSMPVYPNNPSPEIAFLRKVPEASSTLSLISLGSHTGTHVDSLMHVKAGGEGVEKIPLDAMAGECRVLGLTHCKQVTRQDLEKHGIQRNEIILLKTDNANHGYEKFREDFSHVTVDGAQFLAEKKVKTVGVDYLSVQKFHSGNQIVHSTLLEAGITIFEGLDLRKVKPGKYFFTGLPLRIPGIDGCPARAVLLEKGD